MKNAWLSIFKRETAANFGSPIAAIFLLIFSGLSGGLFMTAFFLMNQADMRPYFEILPWLLCIFLSAVTMRTWAEDRRGNTLELLLTFPMDTLSLVAGKFRAAMLFYFVALLSTFLLPIMVFTLGTPDLGQIAAAYLGALFLGAFFIAGGIFISGFCRDQIVAFVIALLFCMGLYLLGQDIVAETLDGWVGGLGTWLKSSFGVMPHYAAFVRGVVDLRDVLFFVSGVILLLLLNSFWMDGRARPRARSYFLLACGFSLGIFIFLNSAISGISLRADWTDGKIYTVARSTRKILNKLQSPALIKLYVSPRDKMPTAFKTLERDLVSKLDELKLVSGGKLKYEVVHMEASNAIDSKDSDKTAEGQMTKKGVYPFQVQSVESDQVELKLIYAAMTLSYLEKPEDIIPQIYPADLGEMEYRLISKIYKMTFEKYPRIALMAPFEEKSMSPETAAVLAQLTGGKMPELQREDQYEVFERVLMFEGYPFDRMTISEKNPLDDRYTALFLIEPRHLTARQKYEINRFLRRGGSVFMAVQNSIYGYAPEGRSISIEPRLINPHVNDLLEKWGLKVSENLLLDESNESITVSGSGLFDAAIPVKLPVQIIVPPKNLNSKMPMMKDLGSLFYLWGSAVEKTKNAPAGIKYNTLFSSSQDSREAVFPKAGKWLPEDISSSKTLKRGPFDLGIWAEGEFPDAFHSKPAPAWDEQAPSTEARGPNNNSPASGLRPGKLIVLGAASMFQNNLLRGGGHYRLILNLLDSLTFGQDLVDIRSKRLTDRTMSKISRTEKLIWRILATFFVPFILLVLSIFRFMTLSREKQIYTDSLSA